ncbi:hypothetical protein CYCD_30500 [Tenuifilaceae bacterium CYCD]|nr:hypothetical protein CYCD_30500 [Tenuifilaceae bacterium CYCD]
MKSVLRKFEKNSIDMSKIYGGNDYPTGIARAYDYNGIIYTGKEFARISSDGSCVETYIVDAQGYEHSGTLVCD